MKKSIVLGLLLAFLLAVGSPVMAEVESFGVGLGIPFGYLGGNVDFSIIPNWVNLSLGAGIAPSGVVANAGLRLFLAPKTASFRPRISCFYGRNTYVEEKSYWIIPDDYTSYDGVTAGIGASIAFGQSRRNGLDFDLLYIVSTKADLDDLEARGYDTSDADGIKISVGYRHFF